MQCTISANVHAIQSLLLPCCQSLVKLKPMISELIWCPRRNLFDMCVLCACCFRETKAFCQSVFMIVFVFVHDSVHEYHTTFIQKGDVQCVFVFERNSIRQLSYREMCVLPNVHCNSRAAPTQTNDASLGPTEPTSLGRGHENDVSLPVSQSPTFCPSSQLRFAKMTTGSVSVASCSDRRKKSLLANCACKNNQ